MVTSSWRLFLLTVSVGLLSFSFFIPGCTSKESNQTRGAGHHGLPVDVVSSASPGIAERILKTSHPGWKNPSCPSCHEDSHSSNYHPAHCISCHGQNGAPALPPEHLQQGCTDCHAPSHPGSQFLSPEHCTCCHRYEPAGTCTHSGNYDVIVIGAGGGGLAAAAALARSGMKVLVIEKHYKVGGQMSNFVRGEYRFEGSLCAFDIMGLLALQHTILGISQRIQPVKIEPIMYRAVFPDLAYDIPSGTVPYQDLLKQAFPDEATGIDTLFPEMKNLLRSLLNQGQPYGEVMARHGIQDPRLIALFTRLGSFLAMEPEDMPATLFMGLWFGYHVGGFYYFVGGSQSIVDALAEVVREQGGTIKLNTKATKIVIENGLATQVLTDDGGCFSAPYVVSNANAPSTYFELVGEENLPPSFIQGVKSQRLGLSAFHVYLGVDHDYTDRFHGTHAMFVSDTYDQAEGFHAITNCLPEVTELIICNFSVVDQTAAPPGKNVIALATQLDYACYDEWKRHLPLEDYLEKREAIALEYVHRAERLLPGLSDHIEVMEIATPLTIERFTLNPRGTILGWEISEDRFLDLDSMVTPIPNLFLAGAWTRGGGQSNAILSGILTAFRILRQRDSKPQQEEGSTLLIPGDASFASPAGSQ